MQHLQYDRSLVREWSFGEEGEPQLRAYSQANQAEALEGEMIVEMCFAGIFIITTILWLGAAATFEKYAKLIAYSWSVAAGTSFPAPSCSPALSFLRGSCYFDLFLDERFRFRTDGLFLSQIRELWPWKIGTFLSPLLAWISVIYMQFHFLFHEQTLEEMSFLDPGSSIWFSKVWSVWGV